MGTKKGIIFVLLAAAALLFPGHLRAEGEAQGIGAAAELTGGSLPQFMRETTGIGSGASSWDYLSQKIAYGYFIEIYSHFDALARAKVDMRNGVEDLVAASYRADYKSNLAIADIKFNGDYAQHVMATEFAMRSGRGTQIANTYLINTYLPHSDGSVEYFKDGLLARIDNQRSVDEFGNVSLKNMFDFVYDQDRRLMLSHEYDRFDHMGNKTRGTFSCKYTADSVFYGTDETNVNKHYSDYTVTETDHTGRVNTMTWKAGEYEGKFLRDMTQTVDDSLYGIATVHRYNMQYTDPTHMTEYEEDGVVNHVKGEKGSDVPFTYKLHRTNITYNEKGQVESYDETRWEQPPDTSSWSDDLSTWTKITTHVETEYLDTPHQFGPDVDPDQSRLEKSTVISKAENPDGSYRSETTTTIYEYDKLFKLTGGSSTNEFSGLSSDWHSYTDADGHKITRAVKQDAGGDIIEYSYIDPQTNEKVIVAEANVISTVVKGTQYKGVSESTYEVFYGTPVISESHTETEYLGSDNTTIVTIAKSHTENTYGLENNMVKQLESVETSETSQPALDPAGTHGTTRTMTTTYTYDKNGHLAGVEGNGVEKGWEYSEERSFSYPYTAVLKTTYEIKLDKPLEINVDETKTYDFAATVTIPAAADAKPSDTDLSAYTTSEALLAQAWKYYNSSDTANASMFLEEVIRRHSDEAVIQQAALKDFAPGGTAADYWALNDVATAEYLLGCIDEKSDNLSAAEQHFNTVINVYGFAQCWNPEGTGFFWHVADAAEEELISITENLSL